MEKCFDWNLGLHLKYNENLEFKLWFKGFKTIISGESGSGKSLLYNKIKELQEDNLNPDWLRKYDVGNIVLYNRDSLDKIKKLKKNLIIVDRADLILDEEMVSWINYDCGYNKYLIFSRKPLGIDLSPNYFGEFINVNGVIQIKYEFDVRGWN